MAPNSSEIHKYTIISINISNITTSTSFELASSHAKATSIKFTEQQSVSQWVSEWVTDQHSQSSDSGPMITGHFWGRKYRSISNKTNEVKKIVSPRRGHGPLKEHGAFPWHRYLLFQVRSWPTFPDDPSSQWPQVCSGPSLRWLKVKWRKFAKLKWRRNHWKQIMLKIYFW